MCDVSVFIVKNGAEEIVLENVDLIEAADESIRMVTIFGEERTLRARLIRYDNSAKRMLFQAL